MFIDLFRVLEIDTHQAKQIARGGWKMWRERNRTKCDSLLCLPKISAWTSDSRAELVDLSPPAGGVFGGCTTPEDAKTYHPPHLSPD